MYDAIPSIQKEIDANNEVLNNFTNQFFVMMLIGGVLFAISDLVLSRTYFGEGHETPIDFILNYIFYYSAQFVIALSLFLPVSLR